MADEYAYTGGKIVARRLEDAGYLECGVVFDGVFVSLAAHKLPDFDAKVAEAKEAALLAQRDAAANAPPPDAQTQG